MVNIHPPLAQNEGGGRRWVFGLDSIGHCAIRLVFLSKRYLTARGHHHRHAPSSYSTWLSPPTLLFILIYIVMWKRSKIGADYAVRDAHTIASIEKPKIIDLLLLSGCNMHFIDVDMSISLWIVIWFRLIVNAITDCTIDWSLQYRLFVYFNCE